MSETHETIDATTRTKLDGLRGRELWRSLEELAGGARFEKAGLEDLPERREFLRLMGASLALAGIGAGCTRQPEEKIYPYAKSPEKTIPGKPLYFATSMPWPRGAIGLLVESHEGRPTKIEGNPDHPASLGATDAITQASILGLYDPDRSKAIKRRGRISTWDAFLTELKAALTAQESKKGAGLRILTETVTSPTLAAQIREVLALYPQAKAHVWEPTCAIGVDQRLTTQILAGLEKADVVLSIDSDFLGVGPQCVRPTREFSRRRKITKDRSSPNRLYVVETAMSTTGAMADHRLALRPSEIISFMRSLARRFDVETSGGAIDREIESWAEKVERDLRSRDGRCVVLVGDNQPAEVHFLAWDINNRLGSFSPAFGTAMWVETPHPEGSSLFAEDSIAELARDMVDGVVDALVILGGNPVYTAPADLGFANAMARVPLRIHLSLYEDESSELCDWHINEAHFLETWSDARADGGTLGIVQPLIAPLYGGKSAHELAAALGNRPGLTGYEIVRGTTAAEREWRRSLHDGVVKGTEYPRKVGGSYVRIERDDALVGGLELVFRPDPTIWDGRFANNGWLQELPKPITKLTWDNAAQVSPKTAVDLDVENEDVVELELDGRKVRAPIWIVPGQADGTVVVHLGYGRTKGGKLAEGAGFNAYLLRTTKAMWSAPGLKVTKTGDKQKLSCTQEHDRMEGRDLVRVATIDRFRENPRLVDEAGHGTSKEHGAPVLHAFQNTSPNAWGMVIDLNACTACGACVTACQAENNIPIVGRDQVRRGREMHWIRVDRYFEGDPAHPKVLHQPVPCMHCENAPCETVCPVGATTHSPDGLNEMTYNRCIGTRYCSNNCPYKVRRFNFLLYQDFETEVLKLGRNPDVSVRSRGVMEKCTYCVQRISEARIHAEKEGRPIRDGEVRTACQQVCPAEAIVFGDLLDPSSAVAKAKAEPHEYGLLEELNTRPRTTYLAKIRNPNPELEG